VEVGNRCGAGECFFAAWLALRFCFAFWWERRGLFSMRVSEKNYDNMILRENSFAVQLRELTFTHLKMQEIIPQVRMHATK
jgi:hypothetical protein